MRGHSMFVCLNSINTFDPPIPTDQQIRNALYAAGNKDSSAQPAPAPDLYIYIYI